MTVALWIIGIWLLCGIVKCCFDCSIEREKEVLEEAKRAEEARDKERYRLIREEEDMEYEWIKLHNRSITMEKKMEKKQIIVSKRMFNLDKRGEKLVREANELYDEAWRPLDKKIRRLYRKPAEDEGWADWSQLNEERNAVQKKINALCKYRNETLLQWLKIGKERIEKLTN